MKFPLSPLVVAALFALASTLQAQFIVKPTSVTIVGATAEGDGANNNAFIDGDGLTNAAAYTTGSAVPVTWDTHAVAAAQENGNWRTGAYPPGGSNFTFTMNLGGSFDLTGMHIWNYNANANNSYSSPGLGINRLLVEVSTNGGINWTTAADFTSGADFVMPTVNIPTAGQDLNFTGTFFGIDTVRFSNMDSFWQPDGGDAYAYRKGIAEVRFVAVPEPTSLSVLSVAMLAFFILRRHRRTA